MIWRLGGGNSAAPLIIKAKVMNRNVLARAYDRFFVSKITPDLEIPSRCTKISEAEELAYLAKRLLNKKDSNKFCRLIETLKNHTHDELRKKDLALLKEAQGGDKFKEEEALPIPNKYRGLFKEERDDDTFLIGQRLRQVSPSSEYFRAMWALLDHKDYLNF